MCTDSVVSQNWTQGVARALPIVMGYVPIGFAFGVLAQQAGLSTANVLLMSLLVYAGSSQLIAVGLFANGATMLSVVFTTFVVNLRHLLLSAALAPYLKQWRLRDLAAFAYELTDEAFAVHAVSFPKGEISKANVFALNLTAHLSWILGGGLGAVAGQLITDVRPLALDYVLPAMFIALLVVQISNRLQIAVALLTGALAVGLSLLSFGRWGVIVATLIGATLGVILEQWTKEP